MVRLVGNLTVEGFITLIRMEIELEIDEYYVKLSPNPLQLKFHGQYCKFRENGKDVYGTIVGGYLNDSKPDPDIEKEPHLNYWFSAFHILTSDGREVTVLAKDVEFIKK